jgi:hypothetical protein
MLLHRKAPAYLPPRLGPSLTSFIPSKSDTRADDQGIVEWCTDLYYFKVSSDLASAEAAGHASTEIFDPSTGTTTSNSDASTTPTVASPVPQASPTSDTAMTTTIASTAISTASAQAQVNSGSDSHLSAAEGAGIGVGVTLLAACIGLISYLIYRLRKAKQKHNQPTSFIAPNTMSTYTAVSTHDGMQLCQNHSPSTTSGVWQIIAPVGMVQTQPEEMPVHERMSESQIASLAELEALKQAKSTRASIG